jgi:hypothetical protein
VGSLIIGSGSSAPAVDTRRREDNPSASAISTNLSASCRNFRPRLSTSRIAPREPPPCSRNRPSFRRPGTIFPRNSPTLGSSLPRRVTPSTRRMGPYPTAAVLTAAFSRGVIPDRENRLWSRPGINRFAKVSLPVPGTSSWQVHRPSAIHPSGRHLAGSPRALKHATAGSCIPQHDFE